MPIKKKVINIMSLTRKELIALAKQNGNFSGVQELLTAIEEAKLQMNMATWQLHVRSNSAVSAKNNESYYDVGTFSEEAAKYDCAAHTLKSLLMTLACVLQKNGIEINY